MSPQKITCEDAVLCLKRFGLSWPAKTIGAAMKTDARAVATALRMAVKDGRVKITYRKSIGFYRFIRLTAKATKD